MLEFKRITLDSLHDIYPYFQQVDYRTCDFTIGGLYMWVDYFKYEYCIHNDVLFIKGRKEDDLTKTAFTIPLGDAPLKESLEVLGRYCDRENIELVFSAVPEPSMEKITSLFDCETSQLRDWSDYIYEAESLATLAGKKLNKKRNRTNKFVRENPNFSYHKITKENIARVKDFFHTFQNDKANETALAVYENEMVDIVLNQFWDLPFFGSFMELEGKIISFSIGEIIDDTLFVHVEKSTTIHDGAYEMTNKLFASQVTKDHPEVKYINREEDVGDLGLRKAKMAYRPKAILAKYNIKVNI